MARIAIKIADVSAIQCVSMFSKKLLAMMAKGAKVKIRKLLFFSGEIAKINIEIINARIMNLKSA